jgi:hypothetical protein
MNVALQYDICRAVNDFVPELSNFFNLRKTRDIEGFDTTGRIYHPDLSTEIVRIFVVVMDYVEPILALIYPIKEVGMVIIS